MRPLRYAINITLDGCCDHEGPAPDEESYAYWVEQFDRADALLFGRVTYQMMEGAWRRPESGEWPDWITPDARPFAEAIDAKRKYVVSSTLDQVDWNTELIRDDLVDAIRQLKQEDGRGLFVGGVTLPRALANLGLIDEYEFVIHPVVAGRGPTVFNGVDAPLNLRLVARREFRSGAVALRYEPR